MTRNPLLLTAICLVHRGRGRLPRARAKLYEACITVLLERWHDRFPEATGREDAVRVLQLVAQWMHDRGGRRATAGELAPAVAQGFASMRGEARPDPHEKGTQSSSALRPEPRG